MLSRLINAGNRAFAKFLVHDHHTTGFSDIDSLFKPKIKGYKDYSYIKKEEIFSKRSPISVFQYIDDSALYYDFSEDE